MTKDTNSTRSSSSRAVVAQERRLSARIEAPYPARLRSADSEGARFKEETLVENLSSGGLYLRLGRKLEAGSHVTLAVRLSTTPAMAGPAIRLGARGRVLRVEQGLDGTYGTAIEFEQRRIH